MKRLFVIALAVVLTVLLCACADTTYQALTEALAEGDYETVKAEMSSLSADFKADQDKMDVYREKYGTLIGSLEAEDYEKAQEDLQALIPNEAEKYTYVDLTMDNWSEYFTLSEPVPVFKDGEFSNFVVKFSLNDQYRDKVAYMEDIEQENVMSLLDQKIGIEVSYDEYIYNVEIDAENKTATPTTKTGTQYSEHSNVETLTLCDANNSFGYGDGVTVTVVYGGRVSLQKQDGSFKVVGYSYPENCKITRIKGTLPLLAE